MLFFCLQEKKLQLIPCSLQIRILRCEPLNNLSEVTHPVSGGIKIHHGAGETAYYIRTLATRPDDMNSISGSPMQEEVNHLL